MPDPQVQDPRIPGPRDPGAQIQAAQDLIADLPLLHFWDGEWCPGGLYPRLGEALISLLRDELPGVPLRVAETGAGNTTLLFLALGAESVFSVAPDEELGDRIVAEATRRGIGTDPWHYVPERSEVALPRLWQEGHRINVALIDGGHGWPTVFVDLCYLNCMLDKGGILLVDDTHLYSVKEVASFLHEQSGFELIQTATHDGEDRRISKDQ